MVNTILIYNSVLSEILRQIHRSAKQIKPKSESQKFLLVFFSFFHQIKAIRGAIK